MCLKFSNVRADFYSHEYVNDLSIQLQNQQLELKPGSLLNIIPSACL